tara:strand:+ start:233 stop:436 length:204 start_codon:yes stop_codon:yes gene_type:complete
MFEKLKSRKFWFAFLGAVLPIVAQYLTDAVDLSEALKLSSAVVVSYIFGQGYVDGKAVEGVAPTAAE